MKKTQHLKLISVATLIVGLLTISVHASAPNNTPLTEIEAKQVIFGQESRFTIDDIIKGIEDGKVSCTKASSGEFNIFFEALTRKNKEVTKACIVQCTHLGNCLGFLEPQGKQTILHLAVYSPDLLKMILNDVANSHTLLNQKDMNGETPIIKAIGALQIESVKILKEAGADLNIKSSNMTPIEYARYSHQFYRVSDEKKSDTIIKILSPKSTDKL